MPTSKKLAVFIKVVFVFAFVAPLNSQSESERTSAGRIVKILKGRSAGAEVLSEKNVKDVTACGLECNANLKCKSANAFLMASGVVKCQLFKTAVEKKNLQVTEDASYLSFYPRNCAEVRYSSGNVSGIYNIMPTNLGMKDVYCDQITDNGGWLVFQRRKDGSVDFYRRWKDYNEGFGSLKGEFWLGFDTIQPLLSNGNYTLRIDLTSEDSCYYAKYSEFTISDQPGSYRINWATYEGNGGDSMEQHRLMKFSTFNQDNDLDRGRNCAEDSQGGWWYRACQTSNLNGLYGSTSMGQGINWYTARGYYYSFPLVEMKIKEEP